MKYFKMIWLATDKQHGQAGYAIAPPKFCVVSLRKTSAVPKPLGCNKLARMKLESPREKKGY